jgi:hypothetical protein
MFLQESSSCDTKLSTIGLVVDAHNKFTLLSLGHETHWSNQTANYQWHEANSVEPVPLLGQDNQFRATKSHSQNIVAETVAEFWGSRWSASVIVFGYHPWPVWRHCNSQLHTKNTKNNPLTWRVATVKLHRRHSKYWSTPWCFHVTTSTHTCSDVAIHSKQKYLQYQGSTLSALQLTVHLVTSKDTTSAGDKCE